MSEQILDVTSKVREFNNSSENKRIIINICRSEFNDLAKSSDFEKLIEKIHITQSSKESFLESFVKNMMLTSMVNSEIKVVSEKTVRKELESQLPTAVNNRMDIIKSDVIKKLTKTIKEKIPFMISDESKPIITKIINDYIAAELPTQIYNICVNHFTAFLNNSPQMNNILVAHSSNLNTQLEGNARGILHNVVNDPTNFEITNKYLQECQHKCDEQVNKLTNQLNGQMILHSETLQQNMSLQETTFNGKINEYDRIFGNHMKTFESLENKITKQQQDISKQERNIEVLMRENAHKNSVIESLKNKIFYGGLFGFGLACVTAWMWFHPSSTNIIQNGSIKMI